MFSRTVISRNRLWFCGTCTMPRSRICRGLLPTSCSPWNAMAPRRGLISPLMVASSVDLPDPFGPTMQVNPPSVTENETPCSTSPPPYPATTPSTASAVKPSRGPSEASKAGLHVALVVTVVLAGAQVRVEHLRVVANLLRRSRRDHRAVVQHHDLRA